MALVNVVVSNPHPTHRNTTAPGPPRDEISTYHLIDQTRLAGGLIERAVYTADERQRIKEIAAQLVHLARAQSQETPGVEAFLREYGLSSEEGVILMCIAEALLRIPDSDTADQLISEKLSEGAWEQHLGHSESLFVNASTWGLVLTGRVVKYRDAEGNDPLTIAKRLVARSGEPVIRQAVRQAVKLLGDQFVFGTTIQDALKRSANFESKGYLMSYDMLGESARCEADAERYFSSYMDAILAVGRATGPAVTEHPDELMRRPSVSVKLSALHPRFEPGKEDRLYRELRPRLIELARVARDQNIALTIDAEEQRRLDVTLDAFAGVLADPAMEEWHGLGLAVQAYSKRAIPVLRWLRRLSSELGRRIPVRLVKGAYWDKEIKAAQLQGLADYPVFSRKLYTDLSYLAGLRFLLSDRKAFYPQFATHNAQSIASAYVAGGNATYEFQRLFGMGDALYDSVVDEERFGAPCRIYAPVGEHEDLLAYLMRRLLENGANSSFVHRMADQDLSIEDIVRDPVETAEHEISAGQMNRADGTAHPEPIVKPEEIYLPHRVASSGLALSNPDEREKLGAELNAALETPFLAGPIVNGVALTEGENCADLISPHDLRVRLGSVRSTTHDDVELALDAALDACHRWETTPVEDRARILEFASELFERDRVKLMASMIREAGKTVQAAHDDVREAVDFLRYYAREARGLFDRSQDFASPTGETNSLSLRGRGVFGCISPWNFPLAIFTGQVSAALVAGNPVVAKPAEQTPHTAFLAVQLLHEAGIPPDVLHLLPGDGTVGAELTKDDRVGGIAFTGSNETAWVIQKALAERRSAIVPFVAETGGINAMIADSSALPEQIVRDCVRSAFDSAGQRCSAARVLFVQDEIATRTIDMLAGAIEALDLGDPLLFSTDIGPVIDEASQDMIDAHKLRMQREGQELIDTELPDDCRAGTYVTPAAYELGSLDILDREVFGPVLHVIRFERGHLENVITAVNAKGYGLTLGLHSRLGSVADYVAKHARVGNLYVNRDQIGAVVGVQPFGGEGLSGTGPKAGGPNYLMRFATERVRTTDTTATGGNLELLRRGPMSGK